MRQTPAIARFSPSLLTRDITARLLLDTALILAVLLGLYAAVDWVELRAAGTPDAVLLAVYRLKLPGIIVLMLPPAVALASALRLAKLRRTGEWDAMQSVGISPGKTLRRLLLTPILLGAFSFAVSSRIAPPAAARFEAAVRSESEQSAAARSVRWTRQDIGFARMDAHGRFDRVIQRDKKGFPTARWTRPAAPTHAAGAEWRVWDGQSERASQPHTWDERQFDRPAAEPAANLLAGQSLTWDELDRAIENARKTGLSAGPLFAERGLRIAAAAACVVVPATLLMFLMLLETERAWRAAAGAVLLTACYWCAAAVVWNDVTADRQSETALAFGVPTVFLLVGAAAWTAAARRRRAAHRPLRTAP